MDENPLAFAPLEAVWALSLVLGLVLAGYVLVAASRGRFAWTLAAVTALVAVLIPVAGPAVALVMCRGLIRGAAGTRSAG